LKYAPFERYIQGELTDGLATAFYLSACVFIYGISGLLRETSVRIHISPGGKRVQQIPVAEVIE
jgi:hypothetical protein